MNKLCTSCQDIVCNCENSQNTNDHQPDCSSYSFEIINETTIINNSNNNQIINEHTMTTNSNSEENINLANLGLTKQGFNVGFLNIQGMSSKVDQLEIMLTSKRNNIDILGIAETKLNENHKTETFLINGYQIPFRKDRLFNGGGGLAVYVKQNVNCIRRLDLESEEIEIIWIEVMPTKCKSFLIGSLYRHPESKVAWKEHFDFHLEKVQLEEKKIIILGDVNRDLLNSKINDDWSSYIESLGLKQ